MTGQATSYSQIVAADTYCRLIGQHLYIEESDEAICEIVRSLTDLEGTQVIELGAGPARLTTSLAMFPNIDLVAIDIDENYVAAGNEILGKPASIVRADARTYRHHQEVDIFVSQGFHHHMAKGTDVARYLDNVADQLKPGGYYICSDEFLSHYDTDYERLLRAIAWYCHVIDDAIRKHNDQLAIEEAKTLLDDLAEGQAGSGTKNEGQIKLVLESAASINQAAWQLSQYQTARRAEELLAAIKKSATQELRGDPTIDLSRGDFKIDHPRFVEEIEQAGLQVVGVQSFGPISTIGGMAVYTLQKPQ